MVGHVQTLFLFHYLDPVPQMLKFEEGKKLVQTYFILLAYSDITNKRTYDLIGVGQDPRNLVGYGYDLKEEVYKEIFNYKHVSDVHLVIPADFTSEGATSYVLVTREGSRYSNYMYFGDGKAENLGYSTCVPFLYVDPLDLHPLLLIQRENTLESVRISKEKTIVSKEIRGYGRLHTEHTSTFIDLDGSMKACLCLIVEEDNAKMLKVLSNRREGFLECFKMELPDDIGPVIFDDFNGNGMNDMAFVEKKNGEYYLKIYLNQNSRVESAKDGKLLRGYLLPNPSTMIFSDDKSVTINLKTMFSGFTPVLKAEPHFGKTPYGIFSADPRAKGRPDLFFIMKNKDDETRVVVLENLSTPSETLFRPAEYNDALSSLSNVISISFCDYNNRGREAFFLNRIVDGAPVIETYENDLSKVNLKLSLSAILPGVPRQSYGSAIPGVSYLISYDGGKKLIISNQMSCSSFVHLRHHVAYIGLGDILLIDSLVIGVPGHDLYSGPYMIDSIATPNTDLIVYIRENEDYSVESHFIIGDHFKIIISVLGAVAVMNIVFIALLQYRDRRRVVRAKDTDKLHPLFSTLQ